MGDKIRLWLRRGLLVFALICGVVTMYRVIESAGGEEAYDQAAQIAFQQETQAPQPEQTQPPQTTAATQPQEVKVRKWIPEPVTEEDKYITKLQSIDLEALRETNPDVIGWILIPDTYINYPIMQGEDNDFYLNHTWEKVRNGVGSIFMECRNTPDFKDFNTILYGHNMNNGSMFGQLSNFRERWWQVNSPYVYIANDEGVFRYEIFSCHQASVDGFAYGVSFNQKQTRDNFIASALEASVNDMGIEPMYSDRILTLSTCTGGSYDNRWVVHARLKMILGDPE